MPRVTVSQTNFTAGELSPRAQARTDLARYANGAKRLENVVPRVQGGAQMRSGMRWVTGAKYPDRRARLVRFVVNRDTAYVLEWGHGYLRIFRDGAPVGGPLELSTPYDDAAVQVLDYAQGSDTMFVFHPSIPVHRLRRYANTTWVLEPAQFAPAPIDEIGWRPAATLTIPSGSTGSVSFSTTSSVLLEADVGRQIIGDGGAAVGTITAVASGTSGTVNITAPFSTGTYAVNAWKMGGTPQTGITPSVGGLDGATAGPLGASVQMVLGGQDAPGSPLTATSAAYDNGIVTLGFGSSHPWGTGTLLGLVTGFDPAGYNGTFAMTIVDATHVSYALPIDPGAAVTLGTVQRIQTGATDGFRAADVGAFVRMNGGLAEITEIVSGSTARGIVRKVMTGTLTAPSGSWSLERPVWNAVDGYPRSGALHEQRLFLGGSAAYPTTLWGSRTARFLDFTDGDADDSALWYDLETSGEPIAYLASMRGLVVFTSGSEINVFGGIEKPLAPTNVQSRTSSDHGVAAVKPERVRREMMFVQRAAKKLRGLSYSSTGDDFNAPDMTILADHMLPGAGEIAYQQEPVPAVWCVRADGALASMTIDRDQEVVGWARHITDGVVESVTTIPRGGLNEVWFIVRRTVSGNTVRYIEVMDYTCLMDAAVVRTPSGTTVTGLSHLEGKVVGVVTSDGLYLGQHTVAAGQTTIPQSAASVTVGLVYTPLVEPLRPELGGLGTAGNSARTGEVTLRFHQTAGIAINGDRVALRRFGPDLLDEPPPVLTGAERSELLGWARGEPESPLVITQPDPLPFELLSITRKWTTND